MSTSGKEPPPGSSEASRGKASSGPATQKEPKRVGRPSGRPELLGSSSGNTVRETHIFLQNFVLIQPRTSPLKICKICKNLHNFAKIANFADPNPLTGPRSTAQVGGSSARAGDRRGAAAGLRRLGRPRRLWGPWKAKLDLTPS